MRGVFNRIVNRFKAPKHLEIGFLRDARYPDGTYVAMVAALQNFGAPRVGIPPRPFFTRMINTHRAEWGPRLGRAIVQNKYDVEQAMNAVGQMMVGQLRRSIVDTNDPPLSPVTLMLRKMKQQNPQLQFSMSYKVVAEARARVAAGRSYAGVSTKPLVQPGIAGGTMLRSCAYRVVPG